MEKYRFENLKEFDPPEYLSGQILAKIEIYKKRKARIKFFLFEVLGLVSLVIGGVSIKLAIGDFINSGFSSYVSLVFSDWGVVVMYWKDFIMLLAESAPLFWITAFLASIFMFLESLKNVFKNKKVILLKNKFI